MNLQDIQNHKRMFRVIDSTYNPNELTKEMIGVEFEIMAQHYEDNKISLYNIDKSDYWNFNTSDLQELTPLKFKDRFIGIGDWVLWGCTWREVYGYSWSSDGWCVNTAKEGDYGHTLDLNQSNIYDLKPLHPLSPLDSTPTDQLVQELKKRGVIISGNVVKE